MPHSLPSTILERGWHRHRGPVPLVTTNSRQPLPARPSHSQEPGTAGPHHPHEYSSGIITIGPESHNHGTTLPAQVEEEIKAAILASITASSTNRYIRKRRSVVYRKALRWTSLSLSILLVVGEIAVPLILGLPLQLDSIFSFAWAPLLGFWNCWRLFRLKQKSDNETISGWHLGLDAVFLSATIALATVLIFWIITQLNANHYNYEFPFEVFWRAATAGIVFIIWFILQSTVLIITIVEKWTKPPYSDTDDLKHQAPPVIVQYMAPCANCHGYVGPQPGEDGNAYLAKIGETQPQGVAPAYSAHNNNAVPAGNTT